jgi:hypothetical protein
MMLRQKSNAIGDNQQLLLVRLRCKLSFDTNNGDHAKPFVFCLFTY